MSQKLGLGGLILVLGGCASHNEPTADLGAAGSAGATITSDNCNFKLKRLPKE